MYIDNLKIINMFRGDSLTLIPFINKKEDYSLSSERYTITENDTIYFALMEPNQRFEDAILKKVFNSESQKTEDGDLIIKLNPSDTVDLIPGKYYYTIKMKQNTQDSFDVFTLLKETEFWVL